MITKEMLLKICPNARQSIINGVYQFFNLHSKQYDVNGFLRVSHFFAQAAHETDGFNTLEEYATGDAYDTRTDLGNTPQVDGDGKLFKGRGIFQITGKDNYKYMSDKLGLDLVSKPELILTPEVSVLTALEFWQKNNLNKYADLNDVTEITRRINGGKNGLEKRKDFLIKFMGEIYKQGDK